MNQRSNRDPVMHLEEFEVQGALNREPTAWPLRSRRSARRWPRVPSSAAMIDPSLSPLASGTSARMVAIAVIRMGRIRVRPPSISASSSSSKARMRLRCGALIHGDGHLQFAPLS